MKPFQWLMCDFLSPLMISCAWLPVAVPILGTSSTNLSWRVGSCVPITDPKGETFFGGGGDFFVIFLPGGRNEVYRSGTFRNDHVSRCHAEVTQSEHSSHKLLCYQNNVSWSW